MTAHDEDLIYEAGTSMPGNEIERFVEALARQILHRRPRASHWRAEFSLEGASTACGRHP